MQFQGEREQKINKWLPTYPRNIYCAYSSVAARPTPQLLQRQKRHNGDDHGWNGNMT